MAAAPSRSRILLCLLCFFCLLCLFPLRGSQALVPQSSAAAGGPSSSIRFAVIGDSGTGDASQHLIAQRMAEWRQRLPFGLVLMLGDNIYGGAFGWGGGAEKDFAEKFDRPYEALLTRGVVFRAALGNHDMRHRDGADLVTSYDRFHIEHPDGYYSFTAGRLDDGAPLVEFFVLNTVRLEKDKEDPMQLEWLERALAESRARWRIVYGHHPLHSTGRRHGADERMRAKLEPLFFASSQPRVHAVLAGHDHIYQRFQPQRGIAYFVCGSSGKLRRGNAEPDAGVAAVNDREHTFMLWEATPEELRFRAINEHGLAFDCGVIRPAGVLEPAACAALTAH
ncbi:MAG: metallophosphoesterase [Candidatus Acidiferrales bacterium]